jgi:hypothetical protein
LIQILAIAIRHRKPQLAIVSRVPLQHEGGCVPDLGLNLDFGTYRHKILKPLSDLRLSLNLFPDRFAIAAHQPLVQTVKPLNDHPLVVPAVSMQRLHR